VLLARALGLEGAARVALIVQCFMPPAVFNYLLAEHYQRSPTEVASLVVVGTLLSFAALPLLLALVL
jgi:malate permease and related proteins